MGRYLVGTQGFSYKYAFAEQDSNLSDLAGFAEVGRVGFEPVLSASMDALERTDDLPALDLLRRAVQRAGRAGAETAAILGPGDVIERDSFEFVMYAIGEMIVPLASVLDERLEAPAQHIELCGRASYELRAEQHPALLAFINRYLEQPLALDDLRGDVEAIARELEGADGYIPYMALFILRHAVVHDLPVLAVSESQPETRARDFWSNVRDEWSPPGVFDGDELPDDADTLFARALVTLLAGDRDAAARLLRTCDERGDRRAQRWLGTERA